MPRRFHTPQDFSTPTLRLSGREAHHLAHVLRAQPGQQIWLFDGQGHEALAEVAAVTADGVELRIVERREGATETRVAVTVAAAVPKGDRFRWMVEKLTELGVARLVPLVTARSIVDPREGKLDRMRQVIVEASKQSGRSQLMELAPPTEWKTFLARGFADRATYIAHPSGETLAPDGLRSPAPPQILIGPEGGFTDQEVEEACAAGARPLSLGPRILRIETAAVAAASFFTIWADALTDEVPERSPGDR